MSTAKTLLELTNYAFTVKFKGTDGQYHKPASVEYKIIDSGTGTIVQDWANLPIIDFETTVTIPASLNTCISDASTEERMVIIKALNFAQGVHTYNIERCR